MKFKTNDLPMNDFQILGFSKADVTNMPKDILTSLLNGGRTELMTIGEGKARLSLTKVNEKITHVVHPYRSTIDNKDYQLSKDKLDALKNNKIFTHTHNGEKLIFQLDDKTNNIITYPFKDLPKSLSNEEKELLASGKYVIKKEEYGEKTMQLDLNTLQGIITGTNRYDRNNKLGKGTKIDLNI